MPATFERLMDRVLCGMQWSRCLVYLDDVISFGGTVMEALGRLEEVLSRLSNFGLQLKAKKCTFMQTEVVFLRHIVGRTGLACDPAKLAAAQNWHAPNKVKGVRQFVGYYRRFIKDFADLAEPLVALTRKGAHFVWTDRQQAALKACLVRAPIVGFPTEGGRFVLDMDASLFAVGGVLSQLQDDREVVIAYASRSLRLSQRRYCTTRREMLVVVVMCTQFRSYLRGVQFTLRTDHSSLRGLQRFRNWDGKLARWYLLLGQFSVTFEYRPGAQHLFGPTIPFLSIFSLTYLYLPLFIYIWLYLGFITLIWAYLPLIALILPHTPYSPYICIILLRLHLCAKF